MELDKKNTKKILGIITFTILLYVGLQNFMPIGAFLGKIFAVIFPFLMGASIAFVLNVPMSILENTLFKHLKVTDGNEIKVKKSNMLMIKLKRPISFLLSLILILGVIFIVLFLVLPEIASTFGVIVASFPGFIVRIQNTLNDLFAKYPEVLNQIENLEMNWQQIAQSIFSFLQSGASNLFNSTVLVVSTVVNGLVTFFIAFVFAIYILFQKEKLASQIKKILYSYISESRTDRILEILSLANRTFSKFISGQCLEAVILGTMFVAAMSIFRFPYALLVGVLIAFTALIPVFGAFVGCIVGAFLILISSPIQAFWFLVLFNVLQQIEGNFIYPRVVGSSIGLPGIWVLVAVTVGGSAMGIAGMLIFIPLSSVIYTLIREAVYHRLKIKRISTQKLN